MHRVPVKELEDVEHAADGGLDGDRDGKEAPLLELGGRVPGGVAESNPEYQDENLSCTNKKNGGALIGVRPTAVVTLWS